MSVHFFERIGKIEHDLKIIAKDIRYEKVLLLKYGTCKEILKYIEGYSDARFIVHITVTYFGPIVSLNDQSSAKPAPRTRAYLKLGRVVFIKWALPTHAQVHRCRFNRLSHIVILMGDNIVIVNSRVA